ncbi:hypothetical protein F5888DRAFT_1866659 [Russula emetica]|nr:hypothetical protein F5888DRAFT_1866659 [Russula emetica]
MALKLEERRILCKIHLTFPYSFASLSALAATGPCYRWDQAGGSCLKASRVLPSCPIDGLGVVVPLHFINHHPSDSLFCKIHPTPLPGTSPVRSPETLPMTSLLSSVTESTPITLTPSSSPASPRAPPSPSIQESLCAPETDDTYESPILATFPSVQSIPFPEPQDFSFDASILRPTASAYTSQEPSQLSMIDKSPSSESPSDYLFLFLVTFSNTDSNCIRISLCIISFPSSYVALTRTPSTVSTVSSVRTDILEVSVFDFEEVSKEPSLLSTQISRAISPAYVPLPRSPSIPTASASVSISSPRGSVPSICSDLMTIPSERTPSERPPSERPSYLHGLAGDRQRDNQGVHDHLGEIQSELRGLADYIHEKEAPAVLPPVQFKDQSVGGKSVVSRLSPREAPPPIPPTVTGKASPRLVPIPLTPPPHSPRSPSSLSSSISFLSSYHSDDFSLMESEPFIQQQPSLSSTPISSSPPSSSIQSSPPLPHQVNICLGLQQKLHNDLPLPPYHPVSGLECDRQT